MCFHPHIEFHYKLFIRTKKKLKNEMIKLSFKSFFKQPEPNGNYELLKGQIWTLF